MRRTAIAVRPREAPTPPRGSRPAFGLWSLCLLLAAWSPGVAGADDGAAPAAGARATIPRTYALLIGCTEYPELAKRHPRTYARAIRLEGCANDVRILGKALRERLNARPEDVQTLVGWDAKDPATRPTRAHIVEAFERLAARDYAPGDLVVVHYSGHGVQLPDDDGDEQDGLDEAWFVADSNGGPPDGFTGTLRDDEIGAWLRRIRARGAHVWCIMDCCHSGTGMRAAEAEPTRKRRIDPTTLGFEVVPATRGFAQAPASRDGGAPVAVAAPLGDPDGDRDGIVAFYAAQSYQEVPEIELPREGSRRASFGLLTTAVVRGLERSGGDLSYAELYEQVVSAYRDLGQGDVVQPLVEGDLSGALLHGAKVAPFHVARREEDRLEVSGGLLAGLAEGTEFRTYAAGRFGDPLGLLGRVRIAVAGADTSEVVVVQQKGSDDAWTRRDPGVWPAEVARYDFGDTTLPLAVLDERGKSVPKSGWSPALRETLDDSEIAARCPPAGTGKRAKWVVEVDASGGPVELRPARAGPGAPSFAVSAEDLRAKLIAVHRGANLQRLAGRAAEMPLPPNLRLVAERARDDGRRVRLAEGAVVSPGTRLWFHLEKDSVPEDSEFEELDVYVFWIDPHFGITRIFPVERDGSPRLTRDMVTDGPRKTIPCREGLSTSDEGVGLERVLVLAAGRRRGRDRLDLHFLEQGPQRAVTPRGAPEPAETLLGALTLGSSRGAAIDAKELGLGSLTWETRWGRIVEPSPVAGQPETTTPAPLPPGSADAPPDGWALGPQVRLAWAGNGAGRAACVLVSVTPGGPVHLLVDLDGEVPPADRTESGLARVVRERAFDAEIAVRREATRTLVWYDGDDDGTFDLVLVDDDRDERADVAFRRRGAEWVRGPAFGQPLLSTPRLTAWWRALEGKSTAKAARGRLLAAMDRLRSLTRP